MAESSTVTPKQPQTDKALAIKDPSSVDDTATYHYDPADAALVLSSYKTYIQDTNDPKNPKLLNGNLAPTSSPFILAVEGSGFNVSSQSTETLKIYIQLKGIDGYTYIASVPSLPSSADLTTGNAFGYIIKSSTMLWIYFSRLVFQKIWFKADVKFFNGIEDVNKIQLESGNSNPLIRESNALTLYVAVNKNIALKPNFFSVDVNQFKKLEDITLTHSPFIITLQGNNRNNGTYPVALKENQDVVELVYLYGHDLSTQKVMMVKTSSNLLKKNPSVLPQDILEASQDDTTIQNASAQELATLEYFKIGHFLDGLETFTPKSDFTNYVYRAADGTFPYSGKTSKVPQETLETVQFRIKTLPAGAYNVVVYDDITGDYDVAPVVISINVSTAGMQIHDVSPQTTVLQNPSFTVNGFNFPVLDDLNNGAIFTVSLVNSDQTTSSQNNTLFGPATFLQIDKSSPSKAKNGNGTISLNSEAQFTVNFSNLHISDLELGNLQTFKIFAEVTYQNQNISTGKVDESSLSGILQVQKQPVIHFLTNTTEEPKLPGYSKSLVRVDQTTGKVIAFGVPEDFLYIVGENFNTGGDINVLIKGNQQTVLESVVWPRDPSFNAIKVQVDPADIKGDATVEVRVGSASSEAFVFPISLPSDNNIHDGNGLHTKDKKIITNDIIFSEVLPYNQLDQATLLNSSNTKVSSSVALELANTTTRQSINLTADLNTSVALPFYPNQITIPANTPVLPGGIIDVTFYFYNLYNVNISTPKIFRLQHEDGSFGGIFHPNEKMTVVGTGFVNGMRYNINKTGWTVVDKLSSLLIDQTVFQTFIVIVPASNGSNEASIQVSNDQAAKVNSAAQAGKSSGAYKVNSIIVNDKYSPLLQINQRLPAGIKMYAKGTQNTMTDPIDANMSIYGQITPFLGSFKTLLIVIRIIVCIIDVICALINPFKLIIAIIALMDCIIDLLSLFPQLAVPIMILSFLQNFVGFLLTFITQIETYVFSIVNSQLALVKSQISQDFALLAAAEQQAFGATKQIRDVIAFLEPAMQIIQIFKDLLAFAMHFPCAGNQGGTQANGECPPANIAALISAADDQTDVEGVIEKIPGIKEFIRDPGFFAEPGMEDEEHDPTNTLSTMFCQAVAIQTATLQTMPGFNGLDSFGNPLPGGPLTPGSTSVVPNVTPILPNVAAAIECMTNLTDQIDNALNVGQVYITTVEQGQKLIAAYLQCVQNLIEQTNQAIGDVCVLAVSAINSELKVSPRGRIGPDTNDDFVKTKIPLPTTKPNDPQDAGLVLDLAKLKVPSDLPAAISIDPASNTTPPVATTTLFDLPAASNVVYAFPTDKFADSGVIKIESEFMIYTSKSLVSFNNVTRGALNTIATSHSSGANITQLTDPNVLISVGFTPATTEKNANTNNVTNQQSTPNSNETSNFGLKQDIYTPIIVQTTNKSGQRQSPNTIYFNAENADVGDLISIGDILEIVDGPFGGLQFPILGVQKIFTAVRLTCKLDITFEQKLKIGDRSLPENLSGFNVKVIAHLAGNDAVAVVPADNTSFATVQILARDHHGHEIGVGLANKVAIKIESGTAEFVPVIPSNHTDITGVIQEQGTHYIANIKSNCSGVVIVSSSVCGVEFVDIGYHANDPNHAITTRKKTVKLIFTPPIPGPVPNTFNPLDRPQVPGTNLVN